MAFDPARKSSEFMRPFAVGGTAFLVGLNVIYMVTGGQFYSPDSWSTLYALILGIYSGGAELTYLIHRTEPEESAWSARLRKGGPLVTLWILLYFAAGLWRIYDHARPLPPELPQTTMKVIGIFFGSYALRQYRHSKRADKDPSEAAPEPMDPDARRLLKEIERSGPSSPKDLSETLKIPRRTVARLLKELTGSGLVEREGGPFDPSAVYRLPTSTPT